MKTTETKTAPTQRTTKAATPISLTAELNGVPVTLVPTVLVQGDDGDALVADATQLRSLLDQLTVSIPLVDRLKGLAETLCAVLRNPQHGVDHVPSEYAKQEWFVCGRDSEHGRRLTSYTQPLTSWFDEPDPLQLMAALARATSGKVTLDDLHLLETCGVYSDYTRPPRPSAWMTKLTAKQPELGTLAFMAAGVRGKNLPASDCAVTFYDPTWDVTPQAVAFRRNRLNGDLCVYRYPVDTPATPQPNVIDVLSMLDGIRTKLSKGSARIKDLTAGSVYNPEGLPPPLIQAGGVQVVAVPALTDSGDESIHLLIHKINAD